jgi:hypothetical protein
MSAAQGKAPIGNSSSTSFTRTLGRVRSSTNVSTHRSKRLLSWALVHPIAKTPEKSRKLNHEDARGSSACCTRNGCADDLSGQTLRDNVPLRTGLLPVLATVSNLSRVSAPRLDANRPKSSYLHCYDALPRRGYASGKRLQRRIWSSMFGRRREPDNSQAIQYDVLHPLKLPSASRRPCACISVYPLV